jgi:hypothetical protein
VQRAAFKLSIGTVLSTDSIAGLPPLPFLLQYYFVMSRQEDAAAWMYPALSKNVIHQPYFLIETRTT